MINSGDHNTATALACLSPYHFSSFITPDESVNKEAYALTPEMTTSVVASLFNPPEWISTKTDPVDEISSYDHQSIFYVTASSGDTFLECVQFDNITCPSIKNTVGSSLFNRSRSNLIILQPGVTHTNDPPTVLFESGDVTFIPLSHNQKTTLIPQNNTAAGITLYTCSK